PRDRAARRLERGEPRGVPHRCIGAVSEEQLCDRDRALVVVFDGAVAPTIEDAQPLQAAQLRHQGLPADRAVDLGFLGLGIGIPAVEVWEDAPPRGIPLAVELGLAEGRLSLAGLLPD